MESKLEDIDVCVGLEKYSSKEQDELQTWPKESKQNEVSDRKGELKVDNYQVGVENSNDGIKIGKIELTDDDKLLHRAVSFTYQVILHRIDDFCMQYVDEFQVSTVPNDNEHRLCWTQIHKEYEALMEERLMEFCNQEHLSSPRQLYEIIRRATARTDRASKMVKLLLAATEYPKFVSLMKRRAKRYREEGLPAARQRVRMSQLRNQSVAARNENKESKSPDGQ